MLICSLAFRSVISFAAGDIPVTAAADARPGAADAISKPGFSPSPEQLQRARQMLKGKVPEAEKSAAAAKKPATDLKKTGVPSGQNLSSFELYIRGKSPARVSTNIDQFGYDLFSRSSSTFAPVEDVPVGPDYLIGPGDELKINVWGKVNADYSAVIDRGGKINLPMVGVLHLSGLTFSEAIQFLEKEFGRYYRRSEVKINVSMGRLRTMRVFIMGKARRPGSYTLSSLSTLINALFASGGPAKAGTMRDVQLKRNGKVIVHFDLYDFLLKGEKTGDIRLMPEDVIFIPAVGPLVGIAGNVKSPAIYELKGETTLNELMGLAGGVSATGYLQRVQVERVFENKSKNITDLNLKGLAERGNLVLKDGDIVRVFSIIHSVTNPVEINGNLSRPGRYEWKEGMRIGDILKDTKDLLPDTFMDFALVERLVPPDYHKEYLFFNIGKFLLEGDEAENILLSPHDSIVVFNKWELLEREKVRIVGAVNRPGVYEYMPNMKLSDLLKLAGYLKSFAFTKEAELTRVTPSHEGPKTERIYVDLKKVIEGDADSDLTLKADDYLLVKTVPEWRLYRKVKIGGEVRFPGTYTIEKGETLSSLITRAGGFTDNSYLEGAVFIRQSVKMLQQRQLNEAINRLEHQILFQSAQTIESALTPEDAKQQKAAVEQRQNLIARMRAAKAKGRVVIRLKEGDIFKGSPSDIILEEGDEFFIPETPQYVQVIGAVYNQTAFIFDRGETVNGYLKKAGGMTSNAAKKEMYILKVDGTAISKRAGGRSMSLRWDRGDNRWTGGGFMSGRLDAGDTIVVPEKIEKIAWLKEIKDITQIVYQIAVTAGVLIVAF